MAIVDSNTVSGVSTVTSIDSAVYKEHADNYITANTYPSVSGNSGSYLFTDGSTRSWQQPAGSIEYRTGGNYTYTIPPSASVFYIEGIAGGGGGSSATPGNPGNPGGGGGGGAYASWFIPRQELGSATTMTVGVGTGGAGGNCLGVCGSTDGIVWTQRVHPYSPLVSGTPYKRSLFANNTHLIYGDTFVAATSTDSITWTFRTLGTFINPLGAAYGNSTYAMCGQTGVILTSTNAIEWTARTAGYTASPLNSIVFGSTINQFVYGGNQNGVLASSTDAITWILRTNYDSNFGAGVGILAFGNGLYMAGFTNGYGIAVSTDAIAWTVRTTSAALDTYSYTCAVFGNNLWVVSGTTFGTTLFGKIQSSTDTITWTIRTTGSITFSGTSSNPLANDMGRGAFATVGGQNTFILCGSRNTIVTSTDAISWIVRSSLFGSPNIINDVSANSAGYLAVGAVARNGGTGARSTVAWITNNVTSVLSTTGGFLNGGVGAAGNTAGGNTNLNSGFDFNILYSVNGTAGGAGNLLPAAYTAITQTTPYLVTGGGAGALNTGIGQSSITFIYNNEYGTGGSASGGNGTEGFPNSYTVSYGSGGSGGGALARGIHGWYMRTSGLSGTGAADVIFGASTYLTSNAAARIATSTDSIAWTLRTVGAATNSNISTLAFGTLPTNTFVAVFSAGSIQAPLNTSTDAINWTIRTAPSDFLATIADVIYTGATPLYITTSSTRSLNTSTDAISWTMRTTGFGAAGGGNIQSVAYASTPTQKFAITGTVRALSTSTDAISWTVRTLGTASATMNSITSNNTIFSAVGAGNRIFTSTNGIQWTARTSGLGASTVLGRIRFKNNYFILGNNSDRAIRISTDGITWESGFYNAASTTINGFDFNSSTSTYIGACNNGAIVTAETTVQAVAGNGGNGTRGGGGGGGAYANVFPTPAFGIGGRGGDGYVRITWW